MSSSSFHTDSFSIKTAKHRALASSMTVRSLKTRRQVVTMTLSVKLKGELLDGSRSHRKNNADYKSPELNKGRPAGLTLKLLSGNKHCSLSTPSNNKKRQQDRKRTQ